jgi:hypothetical protein
MLTRFKLAWQAKSFGAKIFCPAARIRGTVAAKEYWTPAIRAAALATFGRWPSEGAKVSVERCG